ncbi:HEPN domain-containing protein [Pseudomonas marginalis]|uniref:HEPN domain-containing protein n=1 Tax=Pseudomonas marginalis TaxID=298 RepID=UPI002A368925|nr:HEPN domain-containing protein [Pseudomonas marginalis]WPN22277.1 HEPN domain-containing protein [Pseudomonas marginalis]
MSLRPDETIQKILISTTSRFIGEYDSDDLLVTHAWGGFASPFACIRGEENPASRNAFIISFKTEPYSKATGVVVPDYSPVGDMVCSYLSVLFGKRFDCHGLLEGSGFFHTPDLNLYNVICNHRLSFNSHKSRGCVAIPLRLENINALRPLLDGGVGGEKLVSIIGTACKFYHQALRSAEHDPEVAYLNLITAGEIMSSCFEFSDAEVLDSETISILDNIRFHMEDGEKIAKHLRGRMLSIKKRFVSSLLSLLASDFFESAECSHEYCKFKSDVIEANIKAAYDLRSRYVHTGVAFGNWVRTSSQGEDVQFGRPCVHDKSYARVLEMAPTFHGLERLIRYCLLRLIEQKGLGDFSNLPVPIGSDT